MNSSVRMTHGKQPELKGSGDTTQTISSEQKADFHDVEHSVHSDASSAEGGPASSLTSPSSGAASGGAQAAASTTTSVSAPASRKRIFTFQKRWQHTLPIMEKRLSDEEYASKRSMLEGVGDGNRGPAVIGHDPRDVVVCMLCEDQSNGNREAPKIWSRLNCRRGRIENHLTSKHPEFMLLLKHKRDTLGEIAVQLFLQNMREGRCNIRQEINVGLYQQLQQQTFGAQHGGANANSILDSHLQANGASINQMSSVSHLKRPYPAAASNSLASDYGVPMKEPSPVPAGPSAPFTQALLEDHEHTAASFPELEGKRKKSRSAAHEIPAFLSQWQSIGSQKTVLITGSEHPLAPILARMLWSTGANVIITFRTAAATNEFALSAPSASTSADELRCGTLLPIHCSTASKQGLEEALHAIAGKFSSVDFLIAFVLDTEEKDHSSTPASEAVTTKAEPSLNPDNRSVHETAAELGLKRATTYTNSHSVVEQAAFARELFGSPLTTNGMLVIADETERLECKMRSASMEALTTSLATEWRSANIAVNLILLQSSHLTEQAMAVEESNQMGALVHSVLLFLSPMSSGISGSVIRLRIPPPIGASAQHPAENPESATVSIC